MSISSRNAYRNDASYVIRISWNERALRGVGVEKTGEKEEKKRNRACRSATRFISLSLAKFSTADNGEQRRSRGDNSFQSLLHASLYEEILHDPRTHLELNCTRASRIRTSGEIKSFRYNRTNTYLSDTVELVSSNF